MPVFNQEGSPLNETEMQSIQTTVVNVARRRLIGRRLVDVYGPLGPGIQTIVHDHFAGTTMGRISLMGEEDSDPLRSVRRESGIIPVIFKDFIIPWRDLETSRQTGAPLDIAPAAGAAAFCSDAEDNLIFNGNPDMGYEGLMTASDHIVLKRGNWAEAGSAFKDVVEGTQRLVSAGFYGPYAMVVSPELYSQMHQVHPGTGVLEIEHVRQLVADGVFQSPLIRNGSGLLVATGAQNFDLAVAQDMSVAYLGSQNMSHPFRVFESVYLRIKRHNSILTFEPGA